ncbi:hypothetical protein NXF25_002313 [Crotalus adamanteus]|uniref:Uncharacterized protein n=1 Tax=Crotalus adamanteus TaxID=8729 RepID=A0AAW1CBR0_CROAD
MAQFGCQPKCISSQELMKNSPQLMNSEMENPHDIVVESPFFLVAQVWKMSCILGGGHAEEDKEWNILNRSIRYCNIRYCLDNECIFSQLYNHHVTLKLRGQISHFPELELVYT